MGAGSGRMWRTRAKWRHGGAGRARAGAPAFESPMGSLIQATAAARRSTEPDPAPWETGTGNLPDRTQPLRTMEAYRRSVAESEAQAAS